MPKAKISRSHIIQASLKTLSTCQSLEHFSMRKVATTLDIDASTIYWYFANKQALLQAMADEITAEIAFPNAKLNWQEQLRQVFNNIFDVYTAHPHSAELMIETVPTSKVRLSLVNYIIEILVKAGFSESQAFSAMSTIDFFLAGLIIDLSKEKQLQSGLANKQDSYAHTQFQQAKKVSTDEKLEHIQNSLNNQNIHSPKFQFEGGLKLILNGLMADLSPE